MAAGLDLFLLICRASLRARRPVFFEPPAANLFRGSLGMQLPEELFRPASQTGPSGLRDRPRPFVLRCAHLDGCSFQPGETFDFGLHLFSPRPAPFQDALRRLGWAELDTWTQHEQVISLEPAARDVSAVRVEFLTPAELKPTVPRGQLPHFPILLARLRDRLSALRSFYGEGPLNVDFQGLAERSACVTIAGGQVQWTSAERHSRRTGQSHPLGGFTGFADYRGALTEFLPWLEAGYFTGVGRQTVWGKGVIQTVIL
jgi:hypothetical protein